jgi:hypothetical protein
MASSTFTIGFTVHDAKSLVTKGGNPVDPVCILDFGPVKNLYNLIFCVSL